MEACSDLPVYRCLAYRYFGLRLILRLLVARACKLTVTYWAPMPLLLLQRAARADEPISQGQLVVRPALFTLV